MSTFQPTQQQQDVIDAFHTQKDVTISAGAGCGKSTTLEMLARSVPQERKGLLIAFNRSVADEAAKKLQGTSTVALNTHRIAYAWARNDDKGKVVLDKMRSSGRVSRLQIAKTFNSRDFIHRENTHAVKLGKLVITDLAMRTLNNFMKDATEVIGKQHLPYVPGLETPEIKGKGPGHAELESILLPMAQKMWDDICHPSRTGMPVSHDAYLKLWAASKPELPYDFILLDEAQDTNPAVMSVFESQEAQKVSVGDKNQQLFAFNGSINAMDKFSSELQVKLTQSWRFGLAIQDAANVFLSLLDADIRLEGNPRVDSVIRSRAPFNPALSASVLTRTNAGAIQELIHALEANQSTHLIGGNKGFTSLIEAAEKLQMNRPVTHPDFVGFSNWREVEEYVEEDNPESMDLNVIVNLVNKHGTQALLTALNKCVNKEEDAQTVISTVHKVKGREWDQVRISEDFVRRGKKKEERDSISTEDLMLYYVAVTRAKTLLDPGSLDSFVGHIKGAATSNPVEQPVIKVGNRLSLELPDDLQAKLADKFDSRSDAEAFVMKLLQDHVG